MGCGPGTLAVLTDPLGAHTHRWRRSQAVSSGIIAPDSGLLSANTSNSGGGSSDSVASESFALSQPALIPSGLTLKDYQLAGISWLNLLRRHGLGGILADEMVRTRAQPASLVYANETCGWGAREAHPGPGQDRASDCIPRTPLLSRQPRPASHRRTVIHRRYVRAQEAFPPTGAQPKTP